MSPRLSPLRMERLGSILKCRWCKCVPLSLFAPDFDLAHLAKRAALPIFGPQLEELMLRSRINRCLRLSLWAVASVLVIVSAHTARAADEPDLIFRKSTVFKWLTPNDKLATYAIDDPEVEGVACHFTVPERGGVKGWLGIAEEVSDISLSCRQVA